MFKLSVVTYAVLLICNCHHINVTALLNITEDALHTSRAILREVEKPTTYTSINDVNDKLKNISEIFFAYCHRSKETQRHIFYDDMSTEVSNASPALKSTVSDFNKLIEEIDYDLNVRYTLDEFFEDRALSDTFQKYEVNDLRVRPSFVSMFIEYDDHNMFRHETYKEIVDKIHTLPTKFHENNESMLNYVTKNTQVQICPSHLRQSRQQLIWNLFKRIASFDAQIYTTSQYSLAAFKVFFDAYELLRKDDKVDLERHYYRDMIKRMKETESEFIERNTKTRRVFKNSMISLSRHMWMCDVDDYLNKDEPREGISFIKMQVFQMYIANEIDLNDHKSCRKDCPHYREAKIYGCYDQGVCAHQRTCNGTLWDCDNKIKSDLLICLADKKSSARYDYVEAQTIKFNESARDLTQRSCKNTLVKAQTWHRWFVKCSYCMCTCENSLNNHSHFSLRAAMSDAYSNKVVVGVRFKRQNEVTHIQVQHGKLLPNGAIDPATLEWVKLDNYSIYDADVVAGKDYQPISWNERTMCLDSLESPTNHVVTGVRLKKMDYYLRLEILVTKFDFATGKLFNFWENSRWYWNEASLQERTEINLGDQYETTLTSDQYLRFTTSDLKMDVGQSTSPFINIQSVQSNPPVPLSGVGVFLRRHKSYGDILMFKLSTYNFEPHITL